LRPVKPLYLLPVPDHHFNSINIDFIEPLLVDKGFNMLMTITNWLGSADMRLVPCQTTNMTLKVVQLFFDNWYCENGLPLEIISNRDKLFMSRFWKELHKITRVKLKISSAYYPETDRTAK